MTTASMRLGRHVLTDTSSSRRPQGALARAVEATLGVLRGALLDPLHHALDRSARLAGLHVLNAATRRDLGIH